MDGAGMATTTVSIQTAKSPHKVARAVASALAVVAAFLIVIALWAWWRVRAALPQLDGSLQVQGLSAPVEVLRDARGVPHLRAQSIDDAYFAQGYVTAQDRL